MKVIVERKCKTAEEIYSAIEEASKQEEATAVILHEEAVNAINGRMIVQATPSKKWNSLLSVCKEGKKQTFDVEDPQIFVFISLG